MSVGLVVRLEDLPKGFFKRRRDPARLLREFAGACPQVAASVDPLLGQLVAFEEFQSGIELELLPGLEPLHLELTEGAAEISASTSGGGPATTSCSGPGALERAEQVFRSIRPPPPPEAAQ